jgi:hypothetical protein
VRINDTMESKPDVPMQIGCQEKKTLVAAQAAD